MSYSDFNLKTVQQKLGVHLTEQDGLFSAVEQPEKILGILLAMVRQDA